MEPALDWLYSHADAAIAAPSFESFCDSLDTPESRHFKKFTWLPDYWETLKAHPQSRLYHPLLLPHAKTFSDLFEEVDFVPQAVGERATKNRPGFYFIGGTNAKDAVPMDHLGGDRYITRYPDGSVVRGHGKGVAFWITIAKPRPELIDKARAELFGALSSFDAIMRADGILILACDTKSISRRYVALLPRDESIFPMLPEQKRGFILNEQAIERAAWGCIYTGTDGKEYVDESRCSVEIREHGK